MCRAPLSDPPHKGHVVGPVVWLNLLVCLYVCIVSVLYLRTCSCSLKVTFGMDQKLVTELGMRKGLCSSLPCVRVGLYVLHAEAYHAIVARACKAVHMY